MHELRGADEPPLAWLVGRLSGCDLVLIEGFKQGDFPKLEVWRPSAGKSPLWPQWPGIVAIATDVPAAAPPGVAALDLAATPAIADFVVRHAGAAPGT